MEDELRNRDLDIGIPYWDWSRLKARIHALATDKKIKTTLKIHNNKVDIIIITSIGFRVDFRLTMNADTVIWTLVIPTGIGQDLTPF